MQKNHQNEKRCMKKSITTTAAKQNVTFFRSNRISKRINIKAKFPTLV